MPELIRRALMSLTSGLVFPLQSILRSHRLGLLKVLMEDHVHHVHHFLRKLYGSRFTKFFLQRWGKLCWVGGDHVGKRVEISVARVQANNATKFCNLLYAANWREQHVLGHDEAYFEPQSMRPSIMRALMLMAVLFIVVASSSKFSQCPHSTFRLAYLQQPSRHLHHSYRNQFQITSPCKSKLYTLTEFTNI